MSMISSETLRHIQQRLQQAKENELPFGGLNIIMMGDLLQLKPCHGNWIYEQATQFAAQENLWGMFGKTILDVNQRQIGCTKLAQLCSHIRVGERQKTLIP